MNCPHCGIATTHHSGDEWDAACGSDNFGRTNACREIARLKEQNAQKDERVRVLEEAIDTVRGDLSFEATVALVEALTGGKREQ